MAVVCLIGTAGALEQLVSGSTVVHVRVYAPHGFLRDKPEVFVRRGSHVSVTSNLHANGLQVDRYGNFFHDSAIIMISRAANFNVQFINLLYEVLLCLNNNKPTISNAP